MAYKFKKKKAVKEDSSKEFEEYMLKEGYWIRTESGLADNLQRGYSTKDEIMTGFKKFLNRK